ncbi:MAG: hypothetical protein AABX76_00260 [Nanoarchaeota archaeon]
MSSDFLYDDGRIRINYFGGDPEEHSFKIGMYSSLFQRGVLEELAKTKPSELRPKLHAIDSMIEHSMAHYDLSYENVGYALMQARIKELENLFTESVNGGSR